MPKILISCGEPSGDLYAGAFTREIVRLDDRVEVFGLGGDHLRAAGARLLGHYRGLAVTGLVEALRVLPRSWTLYRRLIAAARRERPDVFVAVDFPDFNFRVARRMRRMGIPVVYYIPPQLWAWRGSRLRDIAGFASQVLVIFPFEEAIYRDAGIPVMFVGHPLLELTGVDEPREALRESLGVGGPAPVVALLPGSRANEVSRLLPVLRAAAREVATVVPEARFLIARAPDLDDRLFAEGPTEGEAPTVVTGRTNEVLAAADVVATASGTATVQTAIHGVPMVVVYRLSPVTYAIGRRFVRVSTYAMANLIAGRRLVAELIQDACTPTAVAAELRRILTDPDQATRTHAALVHEVRERLGGPGASRRAATAVLELVARGPGVRRVAGTPEARVARHP